MAIKKYIPYSVRHNSSETFGPIFDYIERVIGADFKVEPNRFGIKIVELSYKWVIDINDEITTFTSMNGSHSVPTYTYTKHYDLLTNNLLKLLERKPSYEYKEKEIETRLRQ